MGKSLLAVPCAAQPRHPALLLRSGSPHSFLPVCALLSCPFLPSLVDKGRGHLPLPPRVIFQGCLCLHGGRLGEGRGAALASQQGQHRGPHEAVSPFPVTRPTAVTPLPGSVAAVSQSSSPWYRQGKEGLMNRSFGEQLALIFSGL